MAKSSTTFQKSHKVSQETREKMRVAKLGKPSNARGRTHSEEARQKNRLAHLGKVTMSGEGHYNWKGGVTPLRKKAYFSTEYKAWRTSVFERDNFTCQECKKVGGELNADHIKQWSLFPELRYDRSNGRTLCVACHRKTPTWGNRTTIKWAGGTAPTLTTTASKADTLGFEVTGTNTYDGFVVGQNA